MFKFLLIFVISAIVINILLSLFHVFRMMTLSAKYDEYLKGQRKITGYLCEIKKYFRYVKNDNAIQIIESMQSSNMQKLEDVKNLSVQFEISIGEYCLKLKESIFPTTWLKILFRFPSFIVQELDLNINKKIPTICDVIYSISNVIILLIKAIDPDLSQFSPLLHHIINFFQ